MSAPARPPVVIVEIDDIADATLGPAVIGWRLWDARDPRTRGWVRDALARLDLALDEGVDCDEGIPVVSAL